MRRDVYLAIVKLLVWIQMKDVSPSPGPPPWDSGTETVPLEPDFQDTPTHLTVREGGAVTLECSVNNLGTKKVAWRRKSEINPLTIGRKRFVDDPRFKVQHVPLTPHWSLVIEDLRPDDAGTYECQVSQVGRQLRRDVELKVSPSGFHSSVKPEITISGKTYVDSDQVIRLVCNATGHGQSPDDLDWFLNGQKLTSSNNDKVSISKKVSLMEKTIYSELQVSGAGMADAGVYVCRTSDLQLARVHVDVLNANTNNSKRGTEKDNLQSSKYQQSHTSSRGGRGLPVTSASLLVYTLLLHLTARLRHDAGLCLPT